MIIAEWPLASGIDAVVAETRFNIDESGLFGNQRKPRNYRWGRSEATIARSDTLLHIECNSMCPLRSHQPHGRFQDVLGGTVSPGSWALQISQQFGLHLPR